MKNFIQEGEALDLIAPVGGVTSGAPVLIGTMLVVPQVSATVGQKFVGLHCGVFKLDKATGGGTGITEGAKVWWDDAAKKITKTAGANKWAGHCVLAAADGDATVYVHLQGMSSEYGDEASAAAAVAAAVAVTNGGAGNAAKLVKLDGAGKLAGRVVETDGTKLDGIEAGADVTDTTNVTAAGAWMDTESPKTMVTIPNLSTGHNAAKPASFVDDKACYAAIRNATTNPVAVRRVYCTGGNLIVDLGGLNAAASGDPGATGAEVFVWQDQR